MTNWEWTAMIIAGVILYAIIFLIDMIGYHFRDKRQKERIAEYIDWIITSHEK